jgi:hypothetical protein
VSYLNCEAAPNAIAPNEAVRFAIEIPLQGEPLDDRFVGSLVFTIFDEVGNSIDLEQFYEITVFPRGAAG